MTNKTYTATQIANEFIRIGKDEGRYFDQLQLQKLVYFTHGFHLALMDKPLVNENAFAYHYGPVFKEQLQNFSMYGATPIGDICNNVNTAQFNKDTDKIINFVFNRYGGLSGKEMSNLTHQNDTPWKEARDSDAYKSYISNDSIKKHFNNILNKTTDTKS